MTLSGLLVLLLSLSCINFHASYALNVTWFEVGNTATIRRVATGVGQHQQEHSRWNVYVDCSLTINEIYSLHVALLDVYESALQGVATTSHGLPTAPCRLTLSGQASTSTLLVVQCDPGSESQNEQSLQTLLTDLPGALGELCPWKLARDDVVRKGGNDTITMSATQVTGGQLWHLDRLDQRELPLNGYYTYARNGSGVTIFILDTGCANHTDFEGRIEMADNYVGDGINTDCEGHGTHCAGLAASKTYGVAKSAHVVCYKVLGCDGYGSYSSLSLALMDVVDRKISDPSALFVVSMSLAGGFYAPINEQVNTLVNTYGVAVVVAAGNSGTDAAFYSPASAAAALTVAASGVTGSGTSARDYLPSWSNRGSAVDLAAPGVNVYSTDYANLNGAIPKSGSSMATPIVAGSVALAMQHLTIEGGSATGAEAMALIKAMATINKVDDPSDNFGSLPLLFLSIGLADVPQPPPPPPPPPAPPLAPPQSSWAAPFSRPTTNTASGPSGLIIKFLTSPPAVAFLIWLLVY